jgi:hypothetical protein
MDILREVLADVASGPAMSSPGRHHFAAERVQENNMKLQQMRELLARRQQARGDLGEQEAIMSAMRQAPAAPIAGMATDPLMNQLIAEAMTRRGRNAE